MKSTQPTAVQLLLLAYEECDLCAAVSFQRCVAVGGSRVQAELCANAIFRRRFRRRG